MSLTVLEGSTFAICDDIGDIGDGTSGFFAEDTRFLSQFELRVNGERPLLLSSGKVEYFSAAFYLRNPLAGGLPQDTLSIARERFIGVGLTDHIRLRNEGMAAVGFTLEIGFATDFADILSVKQHDFALGDPMHARELPPLAPAAIDSARRQVVLGEPGFPERTQVVFSRPGELGDRSARFDVNLEPDESWRLRVDIVPVSDGEIHPAETVELRFGDELAHVRESLAAWRLSVPRIRTTSSDIAQVFQQSISDLASLRLRSKGAVGFLPAAGMPWFMTVFGRDTIITCLQTLLCGPDLAISALERLASLQSRVDDASIDAEPGKIIHELRRGRAAETWFPVYYGTIDATPLFLVLASEVWRWTDDASIVTQLREPMMAALDWLDSYGDRDGDGFLEYARRTDRGLENQSWKDSGDSQRFRDGRTARAPIAPAEAQGYAFDAKLRVAEIARQAWRDTALGNRLEQEARELQERFDDAFWIDDRGGYYALALDADKQPVDALCSNNGHLLWSGIVPTERARQIADQLMGADLWSGWGIRTMSAYDSAYNPLSYHNGTVWPHDTALAAWGLARYGHWEEARRIIGTLITAARHFDWSLPEVFAGFPRAETPFPIAYPTAGRPQAWAAGAPILLLQILLGLTPERSSQRLVSLAPPDVPAWAGAIRLSGVRAFGRNWDVSLDNGQVSVLEEG